MADDFQYVSDKKIKTNRNAVTSRKRLVPMEMSQKRLTNPNAKMATTNTKGIKSLNSEKRKKELLRITMDNLNLRDRILGIRSTYKENEWREHTKKHYDY